MFTITGFDATPDAMLLPLFRCVVCGKWDPPLNVLTFEQIADDGTATAATIPLAAHKGGCDEVVEAVARSDGGASLWDDAEDVARQLANNVDNPPTVDPHGSGERLLRLSHTPVDLAWSLAILQRLGSPLITAARG